MSLQKEEIQTSQLQFGMFVTELDRDWLDSPFLLQGFVIEREEQMEALKTLCKFVYIDRTKSVGTHFKGAGKIDVAVKRDGHVSISTRSVIGKKGKVKSKHAPKIMVRSTGDSKQKKTLEQSSFSEVMSAIKNGNVTQTKDGVIFNVKEQVFDKRKVDNNKVTESSEAVENRHDSGLMSMLSGIFGSKKEKLKTSVADAPTDDDEDPFGMTESERFKITVYEDEVPQVEQEMAVIYPTFEKSQVATKEIFESIADEKNLDITAVSEVLDNMVDSIARTPDALMWLVKLKDTDNVAYSQALNVSINMMAFASFVALPKDQVKNMGLAGLLQDIGKAKISQEILQKQVPLTRAEYTLVKLHVDESLKLLKESDNVNDQTIGIIEQHHERYDGSGYPKGLKGNMITLQGQMAGIIDTYCAMTTERSYAKSLHNQKALDEIHSLKDTSFSEDIIDQLVQFLGMYPVSSLVELNSGEIAIVIQQNEVRRLQPRVMVVLDKNKQHVDYPTTLNLLTAPKMPNGEVYKITKGVSSDSYDLDIDKFFK